MLPTSAGGHSGGRGAFDVILLQDQADPLWRIFDLPRSDAGDADRQAGRFAGS